MSLAITLLSIFAIACLAWLLNKRLPFKICPICAGVAGTWLWMLVGMFSGYLPTTNYRLLTAVLMGGSVVGIAHQIEKRLPPERSPMLWKLLFIPAGFAAAYGLISFWRTGFLVAALALLVVLFEFLKHPKPITEAGSKKIEELKKKMRNCC